MLVPLTRAIHFTNKFKLHELAIFTLLWAIASMTAFISAFVTMENLSLLYWQIRELCFIGIFSFLILHSLSIINSPTKVRPLKNLNKVITGFLAIAVLLWRPFSPNGPLPPLRFNSNPAYGIMIFGIPYGPQYPQIRDILGVFAMGTFLYAYFMVKPFRRTPRIRIALLI